MKHINLLRRHTWIIDLRAKALSIVGFYDHLKLLIISTIMYCLISPAINFIVYGNTPMYGKILLETNNRI